MKTTLTSTTIAVLTAVAACMSSAAAQEAFPRKPVRFIIPSAPAGLTDAVGRLYAERMAKTLKQSVIVENMPGAGTLLAVRHTLKAGPDGHTLILSANTVVTLPFVDKKAGYSPSDFTGVSHLSVTPMILVVGKDSPFKTLTQLVDAARKAPDLITYASVGTGTTSHLPVELFARTADLRLKLIPYKGIPLAIPDVTTNRVNLMMGTGPSVGELIRGGQMRALAITSENRTADLPNVPTFREAGYGNATYDLFIGMMTPTGTPAATIKILADAADLAKKDPELLKKLAILGQELSRLTTPELFNQFLRQEEERMKKLIREANITADS